MRWRQKASAATYNNLIGIFERAGRNDYADAVRRIFDLGQYAQYVLNAHSLPIEYTCGTCMIVYTTAIQYLDILCNNISMFTVMYKFKRFLESVYVWISCIFLYS